MNSTVWTGAEAGGGAAVGGEDVLQQYALTPPHPPNWWALLCVPLVVVTASGNIVVCLAITNERHLQTMTNYFLMSLAITDLMVAVLVMPLGIVVLVLGYFPLPSIFCFLWTLLDVLFCTASIMHLCILSIDRFLSLSYPMRFGRHKSRRRVMAKLLPVWLLSLGQCVPLCVMYVAGYDPVLSESVCAVQQPLFQLVGSVVCFFIPLSIMLLMYFLTTRLLNTKQKTFSNTDRGSVYRNELLRRPIPQADNGPQSPSNCCFWQVRVKARNDKNIKTKPVLEARAKEVPQINLDVASCTNLQTQSAHLAANGANGSAHPPNRGDQSEISVEKQTRFDTHLHIKHDLTAYIGNKYTIPNPISRSRSVFWPQKPCWKLARSVTSVSLQRDSARSQTSVDSEHEPSYHHLAGSISSKSSSAETVYMAKDVTSNSPSVCCPAKVVINQTGYSSARTLSSNNQFDETYHEKNNISRKHDAINYEASSKTHAFHHKQHQSLGVPNTSKNISKLENVRSGELPNATNANWGAEKNSSCEAQSAVENICNPPPCRRDNSSIEPSVASCPIDVAEGGSNAASSQTAVARSLAGTSRGDDGKRRSYSLAVSVSDSQCHFDSCNSRLNQASVVWRRGSERLQLTFRSKLSSSSSGSRHKHALRAEQKATKVLGVIFFTFVLLWSPFFIINVTVSVCASCRQHITSNVVNLVTWLGYLSSLVNPFFYTFFNRTFRTAFKKIILCRQR